MNRDLTQQETEALEHLLDASCLDAILQGLSTICSEKAEHIRANWQDESLARVWERAAGEIGVASTGKAVTYLSVR